MKYVLLLLVSGFCHCQSLTIEYLSNTPTRNVTFVENEIILKGFKDFRKDFDPMYGMESRAFVKLNKIADDKYFSEMVVFGVLDETIMFSKYTNSNTKELDKLVNEIKSNFKEVSLSNLDIAEEYSSTVKIHWIYDLRSVYCLYTTPNQSPLNFLEFRMY